MKTEQEIYEGLRSALNTHEPLPFSQIRSAVTEAKSAQKHIPTPFFARYAKGLAFAAACVLVLTCVVLFSHFGGSPQYAPAEDGYFSETTGEVAAPSVAQQDEAVPASPYSGSVTAQDKAFDSYAANDLNNAPCAPDEFISEELAALLGEYEDQPEHRFDVIVQPPEYRGTDKAAGEAVRTQSLTAEEIYELAAQYYTLDVAAEPDGSSR